MERRKFLKLGFAGSAAALAPSALWSQPGSGGGRIELSIEPVDAEMIDGKIVYMLLFFRGPDLPRPVLRVREDDPIEIAILNNDTLPHGFAITGIPAATQATPIAPGETRVITFTAPQGGSYIYYDPTDAPLNRILGLHGAFIVDPLLGTTVGGSPTPFSRSAHTDATRYLFDLLGVYGRFPGEKWKPNDPSRDKIWMFAQTDSTINARAAAGDRVTGQALIDAFTPDYFHINGLSGFDTAVHNGTAADALPAAEAIMPRARQGQPILIRTMNAGLCTHSAHIHGNHVMECTGVDDAENGFCEDNIYERDVWVLKPMARKDMLLPMERPPDIPVWPPRQEPFPLRYVMHCHTEMSQTAGGGNYPMGVVTHWEMTGPLY
jgi:FtsP/CotA-like multicopper oxidase with cupredoxin domain